MAIMIPSSSRECTDESMEKEIFEAFMKLPDDYYVFHSFSTLQIRGDVLKEHETDFVIFNKNLGLLCIEAKAGHVYFDHEWKYQSGLIMHNGGPFRQAENNKWRLFESARDCPTINSFYKKCGFRFAVCFPSLTNDEIDSISFPLDARRELVISKDDLVNPLRKIEYIMRMPLENVNTQPLTNEESDLFLNHFLCPTAKIIPTTTIELDSKRMIFNRLLKEQSMVLDFLDEQDSVVINGAAGTGKTLVAIEKAKRLASLKENVLFLCYNSELKDYLSTNFANQFIHFYTLAGFVTKLTDGSSINYEKAAEKLFEFLETPSSFEFKHIIIDEGQDFGIFGTGEKADNSKELILQLLHDIVIDNEIGNFYVFYDKLQLIQATKMPSFIENADCKLTLHKNCRNTENIAKASLKTVSEDDKLRRFKFMDGINIGEEARLHFISQNDLQKAINKIINSLKSFGLQNKDIVILTCNSETNNSLISRNLLNKNGDFQSTEGIVKFSTCRKFKGMEADAIILLDVNKELFSSNEGKLLYYVGTSRAKIQLDIITTMSEEDCKELLTNTFEYRRKIKNPMRDLASVLKCHEFI